MGWKNSLKREVLGCIKLGVSRIMSHIVNLINFRSYSWTSYMSVSLWFLNLYFSTMHLIGTDWMTQMLIVMNKSSYHWHQCYRLIIIV